MSATPRLKGVENPNDRSTLFNKRLVSKLSLKLGAVLLHTELGVLLEPPWLDVALTNAAKDWGRSSVLWITCVCCRDRHESLSKHLCSNTQRISEHAGQVNLNRTGRDPGSDHPHCLKASLA
jgi:hypothetical protein